MDTKFWDNTSSVDYLVIVFSCISVPTPTQSIQLCRYRMHALFSMHIIVFYFPLVQSTNVPCFKFAIWNSTTGVILLASVCSVESSSKQSASTNASYVIGLYSLLGPSGCGWTIQVTSSPYSSWVQYEILAFTDWCGWEYPNRPQRR